MLAQCIPPVDGERGEVAGRVERRQPDHLPRLLRLLHRRTYRRSHLPAAVVSRAPGAETAERVALYYSRAHRGSEELKLFALARAPSFLLVRARRGNKMRLRLCVLR